MEKKYARLITITHATSSWALTGLFQLLKKETATNLSIRGRFALHYHLRGDLLH
jgi:hypothetical protein